LATWEGARGNAAPRWSPDGKLVAWPVPPNKARPLWNILLVDPANPKAQRMLLKEGFEQITGVIWSPDSRFLWMTAGGGASMQLWRVTVVDGAIKRVTNDQNSYAGPSGPTPDGRTLMVARFDDRVRLWHMKPASRDATPLTSEAEKNVPLYFALTASGDLVYESPIGGTVDLWSWPRAGGQPTRLTNEPGTEFMAAVTREGRVAYLAEQKGVYELRTMGLQGGPQKTLTTLERPYGIDVSPDGRWIAWGGPSGLFRIPIEGGAPERLVAAASGAPSYSPDGSMICAFVKTKSGAYPFALTLFRAENGSPIRSFEVLPNMRPPRWTPDGKKLVYHHLRNAVENLWAQPIDGSAPSQITYFEDGWIESFAFERDGSMLLTRRILESDVWLVRNLPLD
jgi:Tol biopolymer transport system component